MSEFNFKGKTYELDSKKFLVDFNCWDENFAEGMAIGVGILHGLTKEHWDVIYSIRDAYKETGKCLLFYEACTINGLQLNEMKRLFPSGYLRGACKLAGITHKEEYLKKSNSLPNSIDDNSFDNEKTYVIDVRGFLINPDDWDELYAVHRAHDMKIPGKKLTDMHWKIIRFLRESYEKNKEVPTVYETCYANKIDIKELELLFPDGYHRGVVKIAGLKVR